MTKLPTMAVKGTDGEKLIINVSDYDAKTHEIFNAKEVKTAKVYLEDSEVEVAEDATDEEILALAKETAEKLAQK